MLIHSVVCTHDASVKKVAATDAEQWRDAEQQLVELKGTGGGAQGLRIRAGCSPESHCPPLRHNYKLRTSNIYYWKYLYYEMHELE